MATHSHIPTQAPAPGRDTLLRQITRKAARDSIPLHAMFELTSRCNLGCRHCYIGPSGVKNELSLEELGGIMEQLADAGCLFLSFSGGEPLLRDDFLQIAGSARRLGFTFTLFTNGTLITPALADALAELCPQRVEISLLGGKPETHDALTAVPGSFRDTMRGARLLLDRGVAVQFKTTWMRTNIGEAPLIEALVREAGAGFRAGHTLLPSRDGNAPSDELAVSPEQMETHVQKYAGTGPHAAPAPLSDEQQRSVVPCGAGHASCLIDSRGQLLPCVAMRNPIGDLREEPFKTLWESAPELLRLRSVRLSDLPECHACELFTRCNRCGGLAQMESGSMLGPSAQACALAQLLVDGNADGGPSRCPG